MAKIHIVGAGLSGMVAAIHLAREGDEVVVLEGHPGIGGMKQVHPSAHTTPIDTAAVSRYLGIDISGCFKPIQDFRLGVLKRLYTCEGRTLNCVERGDRPTSIDSYLYQECLRHNVTFHFNTEIADPFGLPPNTILATGLHPEMFHALDLPYEKVYAFWMCAERSSGMFETLKAQFEQLLVTYMDDYTNDYFYVTAMNDLWYALLFSREPLYQANLKTCLKQVEDRLGVALDSWMFRIGYVSTKSTDNLRLFVGDKILTGSLAGVMDPFFLFGIHGALVSGKIAAMAVRDQEAALKEFRRVNRFFLPTLIQRRIYERLPLKNQLINILLSRFPALACQLSRLTAMGVPGHNSFAPVVQSVQQTGQ